ncbi:16533_t:CDS:1, partial [Racocetra persica]
ILCLDEADAMCGSNNDNEDNGCRMESLRVNREMTSSWKSDFGSAKMPLIS